MTKVSPLLPPDAEIPARSASQRTDVRSNMFVAAALYGEHGSVPVRIRNMSSSGALIEAADIPAEGAKVRLSRGSLSVRGSIVWRKDGRAGMRFDTPIEVADWLPNGNRQNHQQQVDAMVHACRTSAPSRLTGAGTAPSPSRAGAIRQLLDLQDALTAAAVELAGDPAIALAHPEALQAIDVAAQKLGTLAAQFAEGR